MFDSLTDYEKAILLYSHIAGTTLIRTKSGERIPAPTHRRAIAKLEQIGSFAKSPRIALAPAAQKWVNANHLQIGGGYTP